MNPELVLVVGDMFVPQRAPDIDPQFKQILIPNKLQHVLSLGNIGSRESYDWLRSLSNDFHGVKGDYDEGDMPEKKLVTIGEFKIGMIHGHQVLPWGDTDSLSCIARQLDCDIFISGNTHQIGVKVLDNKLYINPGSISGAFSDIVADPSPSFILMVLTGTEAIVYLYVLNDRTQKFDVSKVEFRKGGEKYNIVNDNENENENENQDMNEIQEPPQEEQNQQGEELEQYNYSTDNFKSYAKLVKDKSPEHRNRIQELLMIIKFLLIYNTKKDFDINNEIKKLPNFSVIILNFSLLSVSNTGFIFSTIFSFFFSSSNFLFFLILINISSFIINFISINIFI